MKQCKDTECRWYSETDDDNCKSEMPAENCDNFKPYQHTCQICEVTFVNKVKASPLCDKCEAEEFQDCEGA